MHKIIVNCFCGKQITTDYKKLVKNNYTISCSCGNKYFVHYDSKVDQYDYTLVGESKNGK